jgi:hypothetical protein
MKTCAIMIVLALLGLFPLINDSMKPARANLRLICVTIVFPFLKNESYMLQPLHLFRNISKYTYSYEFISF